MTSSDSQIDKPQSGRPKRAKLPDVNIDRRAKHAGCKYRQARKALYRENYSREIQKRYYTAECA